MSSSKTPPTDLTALAAEAMDLWQEHLAACAADPKAKAELMKLLEPSRQAFADWTSMMQNAGHGDSSAKPPSKTGTAPPATHGAKTTGTSSDDGALRIAQLACRVAELEKRLAKLESRGASKTAKTPGAGKKSGV